VTMRTILLVGIAFCLSIGGCSRSELMKKMTPPADEAFARERIDLLRQKRFEQIEQELDPSISVPNIQETLNTMAGMFPGEEPKSIKVVDLKFLHSQDSSTHILTLEYEFSETWLLVNISIKRMSGLSTIAAFNVTPIAESLENVNSFSLVGKTGLQYSMLGLALAGPIFCLYALIVCLRTKMPNFKWLWAIFILFGVGRLAVNWTTGELTFTPLAVHIPCASMTAVPAYGPWMVAVSLPIGAILFMARRSRNATPSEVYSPPGEQSPPIQSP
jgi:hypothetical protein